jgi:hypothetical protein
LWVFAGSTCLESFREVHLVVAVVVAARAFIPPLANVAHRPADKYNKKHGDADRNYLCPGPVTECAGKWLGGEMGWKGREYISLRQPYRATLRRGLVCFRYTGTLKERQGLFIPLSSSFTSARPHYVGLRAGLPPDAAPAR